MENIDFNNLATKDDIKSIKDDLKNFATKDELIQVFVKTDIKTDKMHNELYKKIDNKFNDVLNQGDLQVKLLIKIQEELASHSISYKENKQAIEKHGNILDKLKEKIKIPEFQPAM